MKRISLPSDLKDFFLIAIISFKIFLRDLEIQHLSMMASVPHIAVVQGN